MRGSTFESDRTGRERPHPGGIAQLELAPWLATSYRLIIGEVEGT
jgi:hypothetical protein